MKRTLKIVGIVLAVIVVALIALPFGLNVNTFRPKLESELSSALGRQVTVGNLGLSLFSGSVSAENLAIADDPSFSTKPFVQAKSLHVGVKVWPLIFSKSLQITDLTIDQPQITLLRSPDGKWNFSSLGSSSSAGASNPAPASTPAQPAPSSTAQPSSSTNPSLSVAKLAIKDGSVSIGNANSSKTRTYSSVNLNVQNFSFASQFPFQVSANLPGGGTMNLDGHAGPIDASDASLTPLQAQIHVSQFNVASSGFVDPSSGIEGVADFDGTVNSDGRIAQANGTVKASGVKVVPGGAPARRPVQVKYTVNHNLRNNSGEIAQGEVMMGSATAHLTGGYKIEPETTTVSLKLNGQGMPVNDVEAMLPAVGVTLPSGSSLSGGTLSADLAVNGPVDKLVITGPVKIENSKLTGFDLGSKLSAISKFSGGGGGGSPDTSIQNLSTDVRVAPTGIQTEKMNLTVPALGILTGNGTISPAGQLDYKMTASLTGGVAKGLTQLAHLGNQGAVVPFFIQGTTSNPKFVPDVKGLVSNQLSQQLKSGLSGNSQEGSKNSIVNKITGLFHKKKSTSSQPKK